MKPVYVITRIVRRREAGGGDAVPNLGVHRNLEAAWAHFNSIVEDRKQRGWTHHWSRPGDPKLRGELCWNATTAWMFDPKTDESEELRLEVWRP